MEKNNSIETNTSEMRNNNDSIDDSNNSSFYEGVDTRDKEISKYLVNLFEEDILREVVEISSEDEDTTICNDPNVSQDSYIIVDEDTSEFETTDEKEMDYLRYLIELNEQGLKIDFNLRDSSVESENNSEEQVKSPWEQLKEMSEKKDDRA